MTTKSAIDKLRSATDNSRVGQTLLDLFSELGDIREWAEALTELADQLDNAVDAVETYVGAEGREEKADTKEDAISALADVIEAWEAVEALPEVEGLVKAP